MCEATGNRTNCGPGNQKQTRNCYNGTSDLCFVNETYQTIPCKDAGTGLRDCKKTFGDWINATGCITCVDTKDCGPGLQLQTRTCTNGIFFSAGKPGWVTDECKAEDMKRNISCNTPCPCNNSNLHKHSIPISFKSADFLLKLCCHALNV